MSLWFDGLRASEDTTESPAVGGVLHIHVAMLLLHLCLLCVRKQRAGLPLASEMCGQKTTNTQKYLTEALHHRTHTHRGDFPTTNHSHSNGRRRTNREKNYRDRNIWPVATTDNNLLTAGTWQERKLFTFSNVFSLFPLFTDEFKINEKNYEPIRCVDDMDNKKRPSWRCCFFFLHSGFSNWGLLKWIWLQPKRRSSVLDKTWK